MVVLVLGLLVGLVVYFRSRRDDAPKADAGARLPAPGRSAGDVAERHTVTLESLRPGDAMVFWDGADALAEAVLECREQVGARTVAWQWIVLDNGWVIEVSQDGRFLYTESTVFDQGSWEFDHLTGEVENDGVLRTFEERVRDGKASQEPVFFAFHDGMYQVRNTGVFTATARGDRQPVRPVWRDISPDPSDNVYVGFSASEDDFALVVWTTHIVFLRGRALHDSDLRGLYGA